MNLSANETVADCEIVVHVKSITEADDMLYMYVCRQVNHLKVPVASCSS